MIALRTRKARPCRSRFVAELASDEDGATVMEFGLIIVAYVTMLLGAFDIGHLAYTQSVLNGAVEVAARSSALESGDTAAVDAQVTQIVQDVAPNATVTTKRVSYFDFADIGRPENWNDEDANGECNSGEAYIDENSNGTWDSDIGSTGNGGAGDVVLYTVSVSYEPIFPIPFYSTGNDPHILTASTVKKNQPFADQDDYSSDAGTCT